MKIQKRHSIANKFREKIFAHEDFLINVDKGPGLRKLSQLAKELGGTQIFTPKDNCFFVTHEMQGPMYKSSISKKNVKYVNLDYLETCS